MPPLEPDNPTTIQYQAAGNYSSPWKKISNAHFLIFTSPIFRFNILKQEFPPLKLITVLPIEVLIVFPLLKFEIQILDTSECIFSFWSHLRLGVLLKQLSY